MNKTKTLEQDGWIELKDGEYDKALGSFTKILETDPTNVAAMQGRIACYRKKKDFETAGALLDNALVIYPNQPGLLSEKAWYYYEQNKNDAAINAFNDLLKVKKDDPGIFLWQLYLLRGQHNYTRAANVLEEALKLFSADDGIIMEKGWLAFYQSQFEESFQVFNGLLKKEPMNEQALQGKIACLRMQGYFAEALDLCNRTITHFKKSPGIFSERGWINIELENYDAAREDFEKVITIVNKDAYAHINLAWALIKQCLPDNLYIAADHCKKALALHPDLSEAFGCLGNIAFRKGNILDAETYFIRSIKSASGQGPHADLGALYIQMERYEEAKVQLDAALKNNPNDVYAHLEMGYLYLHSGKTKEAIRQLRLVTVMDTRHPEPFNALGIALIDDNNLLEAEKVLRNAIKLFDENKRSSLHLSLSQLLTLLGDQTNNTAFYEEALKEVQHAIHIKPDNASCHFYNGIIRFKLEDYRNSLNNFRQCFKKDDKYLEAELNIKRVNEIIKKEKKLQKGSRASSYFLTVIFLAQLISIWVFYFKTNKISTTMISVLVPVLSGLLIISVLLPWLSRFKMSGIEADLNNTDPKQALGAGPKGEMIMSNSWRNPF